MGRGPLHSVDTPALRITSSRVNLSPMFVGRLCQTPTPKDSVSQNALQFVKR